MSPERLLNIIIFKLRRNTSDALTFFLLYYKLKVFQKIFLDSRQLN